MLALLAACDGGGNADSPDAGDGEVDALPDAPAGTNLGVVDGVTDITCPAGVPAAATCKQVTVHGCLGIEAETLDAIVAITQPLGTNRGTIVHFAGGGGQGFQTAGAATYTQAGFRQVFVSWTRDWEQTQAAGIKTAACRPATVLHWVFEEPTLHAASRTTGFCGEGFSGGSAQLGYALAQYGQGAYLDYVNELSGPPFARIDLGCDGNAPATATVCGASVTMKLPMKLDMWTNTAPPDACGSAGNTAAQIDRWKADSIAINGVYDYPKTRVEFFDCTNNATAVTGMAQIYHDTITSPKAFHCYSQLDGCQGEGLGMGARAAVDAMIAGCTPRHQ